LCRIRLGRGYRRRTTMTTAKAKTQRVSGATGGGQVAKMYRSIRRAKLEPMEKLVTYDLATYADADGGNVWPGDELVGIDIGKHPKTVGGLRRRLMRAGVLVLVRPARWVDGTGKKWRKRAEYRIDLARLDALVRDYDAARETMALDRAMSVWYAEANRDEAFTTAMRACKTEDERDALRDARFDPLVEAFKANWARRHAPHITPRVVSPPSRPA